MPTISGGVSSTTKANSANQSRIRVAWKRCAADDPELIFDQFIGDLFVVREAGNIADGPTNLGSLEFGQDSLGSKLILVLGHTACGAVRAAFLGATPPGNIQSIVDAIAPGIAGATTLDEAITDNIYAVIEAIRANSPLLREAEREKIYIVGGVYDITTGEVQFL